MNTTISMPSPESIRRKNERSQVRRIDPKDSGEVKARAILKEIQELCEKHGLWFSHTEERKPDLRVIKINEISIKVEKR